MQLWLGIVTFVAGSIVYYLASRGPARGPRWLPRLGAGVASLGLSTLALTQPGLAWVISSICFSAIAILLIGSVVLEILRRR